MTPELAAAKGLEARGVTYRVGGRALVEDVSLALRAGELLAVAGPNGAGKSTLLRLLAGDLAPISGEVLLDGRPLASYSAAALARRRAVMPQSTILTFAFTALQVVLMGRYPHLRRGDRTSTDEEEGSGRRSAAGRRWAAMAASWLQTALGAGGTEGPEDLAAALTAMARTDTSHLIERRYPTLSGGEQTRVTLARVLAQEAPLLLLDEPTAHLDPRHQVTALDLARALARQGAGVLVVVHDLNLAAVYADRVALLDGGRLVASGDPWAVLAPQRLAAVFGLPFAVTRHPLLDRPLVVPLPAGAGAAGSIGGHGRDDQDRGRHQTHELVIGRSAPLCM